MITPQKVSQLRNVFARYHAHVYFDEKTTEQARELAKTPRTYSA